MLRYSNTPKKPIISITITIIGVGILIPLGAIVYSYFRIGAYHDYVLDSAETIKSVLVDEPRTAVVFGSAVDPSGQPRTVLRARLDTTATLYQSELIDQIIVSGYRDSTSVYNEPVAMANYLSSVHDISSDSITLDKSGNNTYATCEQAASSGLKNQAALLITQPSHLDRAIFLCRHHGVQAYGYSADPTTSRFNQIFQMFREAFSNVKAIVDTTID